MSMKTMKKINPKTYPVVLLNEVSFVNFSYPLKNSKQKKDAFTNVDNSK